MCVCVCVCVSSARNVLNIVFKPILDTSIHIANQNKDISRFFP